MSVLQKLWVASLLVTTSNFMLYLLIAAEILRETNSTLLASSVFAAQWVLPIVLVFRIEQAGRVVDPRLSMLVVSIVFSGLSAAVFVATPSVIPSLVLCALFGALESFLKAIRLIALKSYYDPASLKKTVASLSSAMYLGSAFAGALFAVMPSDNRILLIVVTAVCAHVVGALINISLPKARGPVLGGARGVLTVQEFIGVLGRVSRNRRVFESLFFLILVCAVFQGFHNIARTALPIIHLDAGDSAVGLIQFVAAAAILIGVLLYRVVFARGELFSQYAVICGYACSFAMIAPMLVEHLASSLALYFFFIFLFELVFIHYQTEVVLAAPAEAMPVLASFQYAIINLAMLTTTLAGGALVDSVGLLATAGLYASVFFILATFRKALWRVAT